MKGAIGSYVKAAASGVPAAREHLRGVFTADFQSPEGWRQLLSNIPGDNVENLLSLDSRTWRRECFQALYVACWIFHPVEKGSYMLALDQAQGATVRGAYQRLLDRGELQARISSHLSKTGASAHEGWHFLRGYGELLVQIEGEEQGSPYLFLKCEGHALESGFSLSTVLHGASWVVKEVTGAGMTASPELHELAKHTHNVEARAAENFSKQYKKLLKALGLSGTMVTVADVVEQLHKKAGFRHGIPDNLKSNTHLLGKAMKGAGGYIALFRRQAGELKKNGVKWSDAVEREMLQLADRMVDTAVAHPQQHFNEIRMHPGDLNAALWKFYEYIA